MTIPTTIGVFDSGVGGLTVLRALVDLLPHEDTVYLGDTARVPYGTKSAQVVTKYALRVVEHLAQRPLKALVVACNTASAVALPALRQRLSIPVLGVIEPGAARAASLNDGGRIAVLATEGTVRSGAYVRALQQLLPNAQIISRACPLLVPLAEEGLVAGDIADAICRHYLHDLRGQVSTAILGCTHYPLLAAPIAKALGPDVTLVDSAEATALTLAGLLREHGVLASHSRQGEHRVYFTDTSERSAELCERFFGRHVADLGVVDL